MSYGKVKENIIFLDVKLLEDILYEIIWDLWVGLRKNFTVLSLIIFDIKGK